MRNGSCKYGANCRFNHPDPTTVGGGDTLSGYGNGGAGPLQGASQSTMSPWSSPRASSDTGPFVPVVFPPTQGVPSPYPERNGYQVLHYSCYISFIDFGNVHHPPLLFSLWVADITLHCCLT